MLVPHCNARAWPRHISAIFLASNGLFCAEIGIANNAAISFSARHGFVLQCLVSQNTSNEGAVVHQDTCPHVQTVSLALSAGTTTWSQHYELDPATPPAATWRYQPGWQNWLNADSAQQTFGFRWLAQYQLSYQLLREEGLTLSLGRYAGVFWTPWERVLPGALWFPSFGWAQTAFWVDSEGLWLAGKKFAIRSYLGQGEGVELKAGGGCSYGLEASSSLAQGPGIEVVASFSQDRQPSEIEDYRSLKIPDSNNLGRDLWRWSVGVVMDGQWPVARGLLVTFGVLQEHHSLSQSAGLLAQSDISDGPIAWEAILPTVAASGERTAALQKTEYFSWSYRILDTYIIGSSWEQRAFAGSTRQQAEERFFRYGQRAWSVGFGIDHRRGWQAMAGWREQTSRLSGELNQLNSLQGRRLSALQLQLGYEIIL